VGSKQIGKKEGKEHHHHQESVVPFSQPIQAPELDHHVIRITLSNRNRYRNRNRASSVSIDCLS
jgi:hypothetical protein